MDFVNLVYLIPSVSGEGLVMWTPAFSVLAHILHTVFYKAILCGFHFIFL